ncbi:MAG: deoxyhypusine synthase family protein, partial [Phycisphaeraceae bacterium]|nr:deoxyhypusine synthase family protein [Phycisphaeraceae bacterium]
SPLRRFMKRHYTNFNSRETLAAAQGYEAHLDAGGKMMVTLSGAMSTAGLGRSLARMIRQDKVHAISCTGANLEEDIFLLLAGNEYEWCPNWRALTADDEQALLDRGMNRVTDTCIPETVMRHFEGRLLDLWKAAPGNTGNNPPAGSHSGSSAGVESGSDSSADSGGASGGGGEDDVVLGDPKKFFSTYSCIDQQSYHSLQTRIEAQAVKLFVDLQHGEIADF